MKLKSLDRLNLFTFYLGTFISQLGTFVFIAGMIYFPHHIGWTHLEVGLLISACHLFGMLSLLLWGDIGDRIDPKKIIITIEFLAMMMTAIMIYFWNKEGLYFRYLFILFTGLRSMLTAIQSPARNKYIKILGQSKDHSKMLSIFLMIVTQGTSFFSAILCLLYFKERTFSTTILFDSATFLINGFLIMSLPKIDFVKGHQKKLLMRLKDYFSVNKILSFKDISAGILISGISLLMLRISAIKPSLSFVLQALFGLSFIVAGYIFSKIKNEKIDHYFWCFFSLSYLSLYFARTELTVIVFTFLLFLAYALLIHVYSSQWQHETPVSSIAGVMSIRSIINFLILGLGEIFAGKIATSISIYNESLIRGTLCLGIAFIAYKKTKLSRDTSLTES